MDYFNKLFDKLKAVLTQNNIVIVSGNKGIGKTTLINKYVSDNSDFQFIKVENDSETQSYLFPYERAMYLAGFDNSNATIVSWYEKYEEKVQKKLLYILQNNSIIMYVMSINYSSSEYIDFLCHLCEAVIKNDISNVKILIEIDSDTTNKANRISIDKLYMLSKINWLTIQTATIKQTKKMFYEITSNNIKIDEADLIHICESASGNISILKIIVGYLRKEEIITNENEMWECSSLPDEIFSEVLNKYIEQRYECLEEYLKRTLMQSSLIGKTFYSNDLINSFQLLQANNLLSTIERLTQLIKHDNAVQNQHEITQYYFENDEIYAYIKNQISTGEQQKWYTAIINYYINQYNVYCNMAVYSDKTVMILINTSIRIASYSAEIKEINQTLFYYYKAIILCFGCSNYVQAKKLVEYAMRFLPLCSDASFMAYRLCKLNAQCNEYLGLYADAAKEYRECLTRYDNVEYHFSVEKLEYRIAFCTYYSSEVQSSYNLSATLIKKLDDKFQTNNTLYVNVLSLLATISREKSERENTKMYFRRAIEIADNFNFDVEYYTLLRKADICNSIEKSIEYINKSVAYFKEKDVKEYAKSLLNLGMDYLFLGNWKEAKTALLKSEKAFKSFGSIDILYFYNSMGIYEAVHNKNYINALDYFIKAYYIDMNTFKKLTVLLNQAMCYAKLSEHEKADKIIKDCEEMKQRKENEAFAYYTRTLNIIKAFCLMERGDNFNAVNYFHEAKNVSLKSNQRYVVDECLKNLYVQTNCKRLNLEKQTLPLEERTAMDICINDKAFFHGLRFLE